MSNPVRRVAAALLFGAAVPAVLSGCQSVPTLGQRGTDAAFVVGENEIGETCRVWSAAPDPDVAQAGAVYDVFCGGWERPSARVYRVSGAGAITELATGGPWRERLASFADCAAPVDTRVLDGVQAAALDCRLHIGRWPYQALVARVGNATYLGDSIPAAYPAMQTAIGVLAGIERAQATEATSRSREVDRVAARLASARYSAGDLQRYRDALLVGQYDNFQRSYPEAEKQYRQALELQKKTLPSETGGLAFLYMHIALELSNQERFEEADAMFAQANELLPQSLELTDEPRFDSYLAIHYANQGKYGRAAELAHSATEQRRRLAPKYRDQEAFVDPNIAFTSLELIVNPEAYAHAGAGGRTRTEATLGDVVQSRSATAYGDLVQSLAVEASLLIRAGELDEAERALREALAVLRDEPRVPRRWAPQIQFLRGLVAEQRGDLAGAERLLLDSIDGQRALYVRSRGEGLTHLALGRVYAARGQLEPALDAFYRGFGIIGERGGGLVFDQIAPFFRTALAEAKRAPERRQALFAEMFEAGQLVRGPATAQTIALTAARLASSDQEVGRVIRELQDARRRRDELNERTTRVRADPLLRALPTELDELERQSADLDARIADLERQVQAAQPRYNQLVERPVTAEAVLGALRPGEALAQVLLGPEGAIGFFVDADGIEAYEIDLSEDDARAIVAELRDPLERGWPARFDVEQAHDLYRRLFGPVGTRLERAEHVITVPSGTLLSLPFGVLVAEPPPTLAGVSDARVAELYTEVAWMARRHALTLAPSVQSMINLRETAQPSQAPQPFIGFGDFEPYADVRAIVTGLDLPESCRDDADVRRTAALAALPNTAHEIRAIVDGLGAPQSPVVLGAAFSEDTVKSSELSDYRIVYFATHGVLPDELDCLPEPALVTSRPSGATERSDGLLTESEIIQLELDADIVILSACNTGGPGGEFGGESLSGLARAFFYGGARSLLVTHWAIPDEPTVALMIGTFNRLGLSVAEALAESQRMLIRDPRWSAPVNWGAFTLVGDGGYRVAAPRVASAAGG